MNIFWPYTLTGLSMITLILCDRICQNKNKHLNTHLKSLLKWTTPTGTWPQTDSYFVSPLHPLPRFFPPFRAVVSVHSSLIVCWHWQTSSGVVFYGETRQAWQSRAYVSWPRHQGSRLPRRGREVKHFKTKQPGIHMPGRENRAGMGGWAGGGGTLELTLSPDSPPNRLHG